MKHHARNARRRHSRPRHLRLRQRYWGTIPVITMQCVAARMNERMEQSNLDLFAEFLKEKGFTTQRIGMSQQIQYDDSSVKSRFYAFIPGMDEPVRIQ